jgi:ech hydrogenase subunit A
VNALIFLIVFPLFVAGLSLVLPLGNAMRKIIGVLAAVVLSVVPVYLLITYFDTGATFFQFNSHTVNISMLVIELFIAAFIVYISLKARKYLPVLLVVVQSVIMVTFEIISGGSLEIEHSLFVDTFSIIMALIVGIIGSAICLYAIGYIPEYHQHHKEIQERRKYFSFLIYLFISAMFGIVFSNNLMWIFFFWEITTICSALLIGYRNDKQSIESMFRALTMNLFGGLVFVIGIVYLHTSSSIMELDKLIKIDQSYALLPAVCIAFAGLVKSAQFPFSSWLTGAMVAPTPVSALLHSSTMVKAGVYIILRMAPALENTVAAKMLMLIGGVSFIITAFIAISQSNAKKVLAYSTISNLGLIVACAGINTPAAVWSALLLIIFHAVASRSYSYALALLNTSLTVAT